MGIIVKSNLDKMHIFVQKRMIFAKKTQFFTSFNNMSFCVGIIP